MADSLARTLCSTTWASMLGSLLLLWWAVAVSNRSLVHTRWMTTVGLALSVEASLTTLFAYVLLPLLPSWTTARCGLVVQLLTIPVCASGYRHVGVRRGR